MKTFPVVAASFVAGFLGGILSLQVMNLIGRSSESAKVIRASRFELTDGKGDTVAFWGKDKSDNNVLAFALRKDATPVVQRHPVFGDIRDPHNQRLALGVLSDGSPWLSFMGDDRQSRLRVYLSEYEKPLFLMEDENGVRVSLGMDASDTHEATDDDWSLTFHPERASIGMFRTLPDRRFLKGYSSVSKNKLKFP